MLHVLLLSSNNSTVIAHAGDGNFHTVILFDPNNEEHRKEAERLNQFMVQTALSMEGSCSVKRMITYNYLFLDNLGFKDFSTDDVR